CLIAVVQHLPLTPEKQRCKNEDSKEADINNPLRGKSSAAPGRCGDIGQTVLLIDIEAAFNGQ
ncbi:MAG: hypothetical protein L0K69_12850, partial [Enterobacterales bacterium]|nr:hypothetical protein [Enterobacterales bacterium]